MSLPRELRKELVERLLELFPTLDKLSTFLAIQTGKNLEEIVTTGDLRSRAVSLVRDAEARGWLTELTKGLREESDDAETAALIDRVLAAREEKVEVGAVVGDGAYRVDRLLDDTGAMGVVWAATEVDLDRRVALKVMRAESFKDEQRLDRFKREARAAAKLRTPHAVTIHRVGQLGGGQPYIVMELLQGKDLGKLLETHGPFGSREAVSYLLQACEAVAEAHSHGIIHRDLKPANVFLDEGTPGAPCIKVLDFGIARFRPKGEAEHNPRMTRAGMRLGTPLYMSPEQWEGSSHVDARSDIWALGVVLYELLTGDVPFDGATLEAVRVAILTREPASPGKVNPKIPTDLSEAVLRCLAKDPAERFESVAALAKALARHAGTEGPTQAHKIARLLNLPVAPIHAGDLFVRDLGECARPICFVVGAALTMPASGTQGVWDAEAIIDKLRKRLDKVPKQREPFDERIIGARDRYRAALSRFAALMGADQVDRIIRRAVLAARLRPAPEVEDAQVVDGDPASCLALEEDVDGWDLTPAVKALGHLLVRDPQRHGNCVVTTNFDPLIEVAIAHAAGRAQRIVLAENGAYVPDGDESCKVVHLHGDWHRRETLHARQVWGETRPKLDRTLRPLLRGKTVIVLGYRGMDETFTRCLGDLVADEAADVELWWCFHEANDATIRTDDRELLDQLAAGMQGERIRLYGNVDIQDCLLDLAARLPKRASVEIRRSGKWSGTVPELAREPVDAVGATIFDPGTVRFSALCKVDEESIETVADWTKPPRIEWPTQLEHAVDLTVAMRAQLDERIEVFPWNNESKEGRAEVAKFKGEFYAASNRLDRVRASNATIIERVFAEAPKLPSVHRAAAVHTALVLSSLRLVRALQAFEGKLLTKDGQLIVRLFPNLPTIGESQLIEPYPYDNWLASDLLGEGAWLRCLVGATPEESVWICLPKAEAEALLGSGLAGQVALYARWVVPQWQMPNNPPPLRPLGSLRILALRDADGDEQTSQTEKAPWADKAERTLTTPEPSSAGHVNVALVVNWTVWVRSPGGDDDDGPPTESDPDWNPPHPPWRGWYVIALLAAGAVVVAILYFPILACWADGRAMVDDICVSRKFADFVGCVRGTDLEGVTETVKAEIGTKGADDEQAEIAAARTVTRKYAKMSTKAQRAKLRTCASAFDEQGGGSGGNDGGGGAGGGTVTNTAKPFILDLPVTGEWPPDQCPPRDRQVSVNLTVPGREAFSGKPSDECIVRFELPGDVAGATATASLAGRAPGLALSEPRHSYPLASPAAPLRLEYVSFQVPIRLQPDSNRCTVPPGVSVALQLDSNPLATVPLHDCHGSVEVPGEKWGAKATVSLLRARCYTLDGEHSVILAETEQMLPMRGGICGKPYCEKPEPNPLRHTCPCTFCAPCTPACP